MTKEERAARRAAGLCTRCEDDTLAVPGGAMCEGHRLERRVYAKIRAADLRERGRCVECPAAAELGQVRCAACQGINRSENRRRAAQRRLESLCVRCGRAAREGRATCAHCAEVRAKNHRERKRDLVAARRIEREARIEATVAGNLASLRNKPPAWRARGRAA